MTVEIYEGLHEFNAGIHQAVVSLEGLAQSGAFRKKEVNRLADFVREVRAATNSYLMSVIETQETNDTVTLFERRRKRERKED